MRRLLRRSRDVSKSDWMARVAVAALERVERRLRVTVEPVDMTGKVRAGSAARAPHWICTYRTGKMLRLASCALLSSEHP